MTEAVHASSQNSAKQRKTASKNSAGEGERPLPGIPGSSMKTATQRLLLFVSLFILLICAAPAAFAQELGKCADCHADIQEVLPEKHAKVEAEDISACLKCHQAPKNPYEAHNFSAAIHKPHLAGAGQLECSSCHLIEVDKTFSLPGRASIGEPDKDTIEFLPEIAETWADSKYLGAIHAAKNVTCSSCHGERLPLLDEKPSNDECFKCHESYEALAAKTPGKDHASRNPHESHLGPINCTVCHKAHQPSVNYCMDCHKLFQMAPIAGAE